MATEFLSRPQRLDRDWSDHIRANNHHRDTPVKVWNTLKTTYKVSDFIGWKKDGSLQLNPFFQRRSVWKTGAKSYLIDTIIKGFPIPIIFVRDKKSSLKTFSPIREVVDGQQRGSVCASGSGHKSGHSNNLRQVGGEVPESGVSR